jgi:hypothetical protein
MNRTRHFATATVLIACIVWPVLVRAQQSCDDFDPCTTNDACQADGNCHGTTLPAGSACIPFFTNGCTTSGMCQQLAPGLSFCTPVQTVPDGTACTIPDLDPAFLAGCGALECQAGRCLPHAIEPDGTACNYAGAPDLGACFIGAACRSGFCFPQIQDCPQGADLCSVSFCNPATGGCVSEINTCAGQCATCNPSTGMCDLEPMPDGTECDDDQACTSGDHCVGGACTGSVGAAGCTGDCDGGGDVAVNELIALVNIALGTAPQSTCPLGVPSGAEVDIALLVRGVGNALNGCAG